MLKVKSVQMIEVQDWDGLVEETYGRPYSFQQQDGCKDRGTFDLTVPEECEDSDVDSIPDKVNGREMGVSFKAWLARDPKEWNGDPEDNSEWCIRMFWERNFYPDVQLIANDLHTKGLLPAGKYIINIDW